MCWPTDDGLSYKERCSRPSRLAPLAIKARTHVKGTTDNFVQRDALLEKP